MLSTPIKKIYEWAEEYDKTIPLSDFNKVVQIVHEEGTVLTFHYAVVVRYQDYFVVFPEHHKLCAYHKDEALVYCMERAEIPEIK